MGKDHPETERRHILSQGLKSQSLVTSIPQEEFKVLPGRGYT